MEQLCPELVTKEDEAIAKELEGIEPLFNFERGCHLKIYSKKPLSISDMVLLLKNFAIECKENYSYTVTKYDTYVYAFNIECEKDLLQKHQDNVKNLIKAALEGKELLNCSLYALATKANFSQDQIRFLRAMAKYLNQIIVERNEHSIINSFIDHAEATKALVDLFFYKKLDRAPLEQIKSHQESKLFEIFLAALRNLKKTNFFTPSIAKSFKFETQNFKHLLVGLQPNIEIFVYHPDFIGVHLRSSKVARGGIRYSNREDLRQEIKSLMITQEAKNSIIIPSGGKGGFYPLRPIKKEEFETIYSLYIEALLDLIDLSPKSGDDFYFVVAADRGTASMSDVANQIAIKRNYWLGDAFASGGSHGYSHKRLGVTAKGAWRAANRHFHERNIDIFKDPITVVGTGSMRGDVFGNGMLINPNIRLLGAISSHEIFIDPDPDPHIAYEERKRLFENALGWSAYDPKKISEGGGVFQRDAAKITLSKQIKELLGIAEDFISGEELAQALLCANADLLYIGGIGTYIKSSEELNIHIPDKINEGVRVDAANLRCYAICEGGNLGITQLGRIEYAKNGGKINLDHIDNSAGVHTSDYEVNLKITLEQALEEKKITQERKYQILESITQEVLQKVFFENQAQPLAITLDQIASRTYLEEYTRAIDILEKEVEYFKRKDYHIPKNRDIEQILDQNRSLVRPVLGILLSYSKIFIKDLLLRSSLIKEPFFEHYLYKYFPKSIYPAYEQEVLTHPLRERIIATTIANIVIDQMGVRFICDYEELGEELFLVKIKAFMILHSLLSIAKVKQELLNKEFELQKRLYEMLLQINESLEFSLKWVLRNYQEFNLEPFHILNYKQEIQEFLEYDEGRSQGFFKYVDLTKFTMLAIYLKENRDYPLKDILELLTLIINHFQIDTLLKYLYSFEPKNPNAKEIKMELILLVEYFVTLVAKNIILFMRRGEDIKRGFRSYLQEKMVDTKMLKERIERIKKDPNDLMLFVNVVNKLLLEAI